MSAGGCEFIYAQHFKEMNVPQDVYFTFSDRKNASDKFLYVYSLLKNYNWLPQKYDGFIKLSQAHRRWRKRLKKRLNNSGILIDMDCSTMKKDDEISDFYRLRGNKEFKDQNYEESLNLYTLSIMTAKIDSLNFSLSMANRSAALFHLKEYEHCLRDIDQSLASNKYPSQNLYKLFERKGICHQQMNRRSLALEMYLNSLIHLNDNVKLPLVKKEEIKIRISECITKCKSLKDEPKIPKENRHDVSERQNYDLPFLSKCVVMKYSERMGRGLFVTRNVEPGEILIMEKHSAGVCRNNSWKFNCDYCFKRCLSGIPCATCSRVLYCNRTCLQKAYDSYHNTECSLVYPLKGDPTVEPHHDLALRCFLQLTTAMGMDRYCASVRAYRLGDRADGPEPDSGRPMEDPPWLLQTDRYGFRSIYGLGGNEAKRSVSNMFFMHCTAAMMVSLLALNDYHVPADSLGTVGESLVHLLCVATANAHASVEPRKHAAAAISDVFSRLRDPAATFDTVALVLCPAHSLINHSCDPNVFVRLHNGTHITRAVQPISKGSQLFVDYGVNFMSCERQERNQHLFDQYQFHCQCQACLENWPTYSTLELRELFNSNHPYNEDNKFGIPKMTLAKFNEIIHLSSTQHKVNVEFLNFLFSFLNLLNSNFKKPCINYCKCIRAIKKYLYYTSDQLYCVIE